jgi:hypothetical protein
VIRHVVSLPEHMGAAQCAEFMERWKAAASKREAIDVAVAGGASVQTLITTHPRASFLRRARASVR